MLKYGSHMMKEHLLRCYNETLGGSSIQKSCHETIFQMLPKNRDLNKPSNWRPIAILPILYKVFSKLLYNRIAPELFAHQSIDQYTFTPHISIEDALLCCEVAIEYSLEFDIPLWMMSMDMRTAFDTIDHSALFTGLSHHGVALLLQNISSSSNLYIKISVILSMTVQHLISLGIAFEQWKMKLQTEGLYIGQQKRLTNTRYADDILLYAKSLVELQHMSELFISELNRVDCT